LTLFDAEPQEGGAKKKAEGGGDFASLMDLLVPLLFFVLSVLVRVVDSGVLCVVCVVWCVVCVCVCVCVSECERERKRVRSN